MAKKLFLLLLTSIFLFYSWLGAAAEDKAGAADDNPVKVINNITIDTIKKEIRLNCQLALEEGILEFMLVDEKGQTYECAFKILENKPSELHFGLLLLGFNPVAFNDYKALLNNKDAVKILKEKQCLLELEIRKNDKIIPMDTILKNRESGKKEPLYWVFTGGFFTEKNVYAADLTMIYLSIWPEMSATINLLSDSGNPYRGEQGYEIAAKHNFKVDDEFTLIIRGVK